MEHSFPAKFLVKRREKNGLGLLEKESSQTQSHTRTLSGGQSRRLLSHRSGTEQKFHTNYTAQAKPRCFCNCLSSPAQKRKGERKKKSGPWWWPRGTDRQQKEKLFGLWATKTKDRMRLCFMSTLTDKSTCTCAHKKPTTTRSQHGLDLSAKGYSLNSRHYKVMICRQALLKPTELYLKF